MTGSHLVRIYYEDTDAGGVVYHAAYPRFFERARTEWLRELGFEQRRLATDSRLLFAVRRLQLDFKRPAHLDDHLRIDTAIEAMGRTSVDFEQHLWREDVLIATQKTGVVCVGGDSFRPSPIPEPLRRQAEGFLKVDRSPA